MEHVARLGVVDGGSACQRRPQQPTGPVDAQVPNGVDRPRPLDRHLRVDLLPVLSVGLARRPSLRGDRGDHVGAHVVPEVARLRRREDLKLERALAHDVHGAQDHFAVALDRELDRRAFDRRQPEGAALEQLVVFGCLGFVVGPDGLLGLGLDGDVGLRLSGLGLLLSK